MFLDAIKKGYAHIKSAFWGGLFTVIPLAATLFFVSFLYGFLKKHLLPLRMLEPVVLQRIPGSEFVLVMLVIIAIGIVVKVFVAHKIIHYTEQLINRIPLVRIVYSSSKILVDFFKMSGKTTVQRRVVLIPYPRLGQYHLAFLLDSAEHTYQEIIPEHFKHDPQEKYVKIFMPNSPNVTAGYFFIMQESEIIYTDISFEDAIKTLVSCGLMTPESLQKK